MDGGTGHGSYERRMTMLLAGQEKEEGTPNQLLLPIPQLLVKDEGINPAANRVL